MGAGEDRATGGEPGDFILCEGGYGAGGEYCRVGSMSGVDRVLFVLVVGLCPWCAFGQLPERIRPTFEPRRITGDPTLLLSKLQSGGTLREEALATLELLGWPMSVLGA